MLIRIFDAVSDREIVNGRLVSLTYIDGEAHWYLSQVHQPAEVLKGCPGDDETPYRGIVKGGA